ncbi:MAG TPA: hypothetical protein VIH61_00485 [Waddliaceae bacterium]
MKKVCVFATFLLLGLIPQYGSAQNPDGSYEVGEVDPNCEYPAGPCVCECPYTRYKPEYYYTTRCVQEPYVCYKKCCRSVPQYYEVQKCRMVPEYYTVQCCRQVKENYCVPETKYCTKKIRDCHCRYVPCTYTKRTSCYPDQIAGQNYASGTCPQSSGRNAYRSHQNYNRPIHDRPDNESENTGYIPPFQR